MGSQPGRRDLEERLQAVGVAAGEALHPRLQVEHPAFVGRGYPVAVEQPGSGPLVLEGPALTGSRMGSPRSARRPPCHSTPPRFSTTCSGSTRRGSPPWSEAVRSTLCRRTPPRGDCGQGHPSVKIPQHVLAAGEQWGVRKDAASDHRSGDRGGSGGRRDRARPHLRGRRDRRQAGPGGQGRRPARRPPGAADGPRRPGRERPLRAGADTQEVAAAQKLLDETNADLDLKRSLVRDAAVDAYQNGNDSPEFDAFLTSESDAGLQKRSYL